MRGRTWTAALLLVGACGRSSVTPLAGWGTGSGDASGPARRGCRGELDEVLGYWRLDTLDGARSPDDGPLGNDAVIEGGTLVEDGALGSALRFDGHGYATVEGDGLEPRKTVSVTAWARPAVLADEGWNSIVGKGALHGTLDRYWLGYYQHGVRLHVSDGEQCFSLFDDADYRTHVGSWHHLAATFVGDLDEVKVFGCALTGAQVQRDAARDWPFGGG